MKADFDETLTIRSMIQGVLRRALAISMTGVAILAAAYALFHIRSSQRQAEELLLKEVSSQSMASLMAQDVLSVEKEINRFVEAWSETQPFSTEVLVFSGSQMIARAGRVSGPKIFSSVVRKTVALPSGKDLSISITLNTGLYLLQVISSLAALEILLLLFFSLLHREFSKSVDSIVAPLGEMVDWLEGLSADLPDSIRELARPRRVALSEVKSLTTSIETLLEEILFLENRLAKAQIDRARIEIAEQVAHDLRSPLGSLDLLLARVPEFSQEKQKRVRDALSRIRAIVQSLKDTPARAEGGLVSIPTPSKPAKLPSLALWPLIESVLAEKRIHLESGSRVLITGPAVDRYALSSRVDGPGFQRVVSNLLDNSLDALASSGRVDLDLMHSGDVLLLTIKDTGRGIAPDLLPRLMKRGETYGKSGGSGLGLFHAKQWVEDAGGSIQIESAPKHGTLVTIRLPATEPPEWLADRLLLEPGTTVTIVDDDPLIHDLWKRRFSELTPAIPAISLRHEYSPSVLRKNKRTDGHFYLLDYEFSGESMTGLDLARELDIAGDGILVSGRFDSDPVVEGCRALGMKRMSKDWISAIPIQISTKFSQASGRAIRHSGAMQRSNPPNRANHREVGDGKSHLY